MLSKTRFQHGVRCQKRLWLDAHRRELARPPDRAERLRLADGHRVGKLARALYPGGILVTEPSARHARAVARTRSLLDDPEVGSIFEGAFEHDGLRVRADILVRSGSGFEILEVKSSSQLREEHVRDLAIQAFVIDGCGVELGEATLVHLDPRYEWDGRRYEPSLLFARVDVTARVFAMREEIERQAAAFREVLGRDAPPAVALGRQCLGAQTCPFLTACRREAGPRVAADEALGRIRAGGSVRQALQAPVSFLDVQTYATALPRLTGAKPHERVPFLCWLANVGADGRLREIPFLPSLDGAGGPAGLASRLAEAAPRHGTVVVFGAQTIDDLRILQRWSSTEGCERLRDLETRSILLEPLLDAQAPPPFPAEKWTWDAVLAARARPAFARRAEVAASYVRALEPGVSRAEKTATLRELERYARGSARVLAALAAELGANPP